jgi:hypothetical protein
VQGPKLRQGRRGSPQEEPAERRGIGIARQAGEVLKDSVLAEQLRRLEAFQPEDHRVEQRQQHLADAVAMVSLDERHVPGDGVLESDAGQEPMQEIDAPIVGEVLRSKRDGQSSRSSGHLSEPYFLSSFHSRDEKSSWPCPLPPKDTGHQSFTPDSGL